LATSVREFVSLGLVGIETHKSEREAALHFALQQLNLTAFAQRNYWSLSGGQQQRVRVARALVRRPYFLLMDEPTNGLDLAVQSALLEDLARLQHEGLTILLVSHDLQLATQYATHHPDFETVVWHATIAALSPLFNCSCLMISLALGAYFIPVISQAGWWHFRCH
jgi:ABC-type Mn2+/Zn2+ transport system ATPase subunit